MKLFQYVIAKKDYQSSVLKGNLYFIYEKSNSQYFFMDEHHKVCGGGNLTFMQEYFDETKYTISVGAKLQSSTDTLVVTRLSKDGKIFVLSSENLDRTKSINMKKIYDDYKVLKKNNLIKNIGIISLNFKDKDGKKSISYTIEKMPVLITSELGGKITNIEMDDSYKTRIYNYILKHYSLTNKDFPKEDELFHKLFQYITTYAYVISSFDDYIK